MKAAVKISLFILSTVWLLGIILPFLSVYFPSLAKLLPYAEFIYRPVCHQQPDKLICKDGLCTFVCARCFGIYIGVFISSLAVLFIKFKQNISIKYFVISAVPLFLDVIFVSSGFYNYSKTIAFITGIIFGSASFYYFYNGIILLLKEKRNR